MLELYQGAEGLPQALGSVDGLRGQAAPRHLDEEDHPAGDQGQGPSGGRLGGEGEEPPEEQAPVGVKPKKQKKTKKNKKKKKKKRRTGETTPSTNRGDNPFNKPPWGAMELGHHCSIDPMGRGWSPWGFLPEEAPKTGRA